MKVIFIIFCFFAITLYAKNNINKSGNIYETNLSSDTTKLDTVKAGYFECILFHFSIVYNGAKLQKAKGFGVIKATVEMCCDGNWYVRNPNLRGSTYTGNDSRSIIDFYLKNSTITMLPFKSTKYCEHVGMVTINVLNRN